MVYRFIIYSGGMDSFTLLNSLTQLYNSNHLEYLQAISFDYGQRHSKELLYAREVCELLGVQHHIVSLGVLLSSLVGVSSLTDKTLAVPEGHYADESMKQTVVPGRNTLMLTYAMAKAEATVRKAEAEGRADMAVVYYAAHSGDHAIYPDCRPDYFDSMTKTVKLATDGRVVLAAPYLRMTKGDIVKIGLAMKLDYRMSWTCYKGGNLACGKCGSCVERLEAFGFAGATDPLPYEVTS